MMADNTDHRQKRNGSNYNRKNKSTLSSHQKALLVFKHLNQVEQSQFPLSVITEKFSSGALTGKLNALWLRILTSSTEAELKQYYVDVVENSKTPMPHLKEECHHLLSEHSIDTDIMQPPPNPTQINKDNNQGFTPNLTKNSRAQRIVWDDMSECSVGQFFTNRVYLDQNYNRPWIPAHLGPDQHTKMLAFDEVVALNDLQMAVLVNSTWMMDCLYYVVKFPKQVDLTVICPRSGSSDVNYHDSRIPAEHRSLIVCEQHIDSIMANDQGVIQNTSCCLGDCSGVRNVKLIHSHDSNNINANFYLLRYSDKLRVVVYTGPLARTHWERVIHFGWFYDFPIKHIEDTDTTQLLDTSGNRFSQDLHLLLDQLDYKESDGRGDLLKTVQFARLSQYVQLITAAPSRHMREADCCYGLPRLTRLLQVIHWQNVHSCQKLCQSWKMGTGNGVSLLQSLFNLRQPVRRKSSVVSSLQLLYPSKTYMRKCMDNFPDLQEEVNHMFSNNDRYNLAGPYLRDICFQKPVISRANLLLMYERISASCTKISETKSESVAEVKSAAETDKKYGKFGFLFTGSQTLGYGSWGGQKGTPGSYHFARYELGVGLFPYFNQHTQEQHALDLTEIGLHLDMDHIQQYRNTCVPYTPWHEWSPKKNIFYRSLVIINHKKKGELVFADGFSANHPFMTHTDYEPLPESCNSALMKPSRQSNQRLPSCTSVLDVILFKGDKGMWGDSSGIINTFKDKYATAVHFGLEEVYKTYQEEFSSVKKYPVTDSWSGNPIQILKPKREETFHEKMQELGLKSDEEIENYMQKFQLNILAFQKQILPHLDENAPNPDCRSTFINTDINWLEEHVRQTCFDKCPRKMIGPYNIDILQQQVKGHRKCVVISDIS